jgi:NAD(P)-dependent dehydrogenase (short-subunit alcohol dehydrogenase family)
LIKINSSTQDASDYEAWYQLNGRLKMPCVSTVPEPVWQKIVAKILVQRLGQPADVAGAVVFLAVRDAGFITRATLSGGNERAEAVASRHVAWSHLITWRRDP